MLFCIFSFNRGQFLENCIDSIKCCVPGARIVVFDDHSNDDYTKRVLERCATEHSLVQPEHRLERRLGGLYGNMQLALDWSQQNVPDEKLVCFLQDDTQMVRVLGENDLAQLDALFEGDEQLAFISPCFLRGRNRKRDLNSMTFDETRQLYFRTGTKQSAGNHFSALLLTRPSRLQSNNWRFEASEPANDRKAAQLFGPMAYLHAPFAMWLPEVPTWRGKRKTWALKYAERKRNSGYFPFQILSQEQVQDLQQRSAAELPFAEDFLHCVAQTPPAPWAYHPMQDDRWLQKLSAAELSLRRLLHFG